MATQFLSSVMKQDKFDLKYLLLTKHVQAACFGGTVTNSIPRQALIIACLASIDSWKSELLIATKNISCVFPYPSNVRRRITSDITVKS